MRWYEIVCEAAPRPTLPDYVSLGLDPTAAEAYLKARIPLDRAAAYIRALKKYPPPDGDEVAEVMRWEKYTRQREKNDSDYNRLVASLPQLAASTGPLTHEQACAVIANDDDLFDAVAMSVGNPDWLEDDLRVSARLMAVIQRIKPSRHVPFYRGECAFSDRDSHKRGFHSWTPARDTADYFWKDCGRGRGRLLMLTVPIKAISFEMIGTWRMRLRDSESHYIGAQAEYLVPDGYSFKVIGET